MTRGRTKIPGDWYPGSLPDNVQLSETAYVASSFSFRKFYSERSRGAVFEPSASLYDSATLYVGRTGQVRFAAFALMNGGALFCETEVEIGPYSLIAWDVVIMDSTIVSLHRQERRAQLESAAFRSARSLGPVQGARPVRIGRNVWISFGACILPGVTIGDHAIVAARAVVSEDVPPCSVVAGNPARVVRVFDPPASEAAPDNGEEELSARAAAASAES